MGFVTAILVSSSRDSYNLRQDVICCNRCSRREALKLASSTVAFGIVAGGVDVALCAASAEDGTRDDGGGVYRPAFAKAMEEGMKEYENEVEGRKRKLFRNTIRPGDKILELGIGTGPNLR